MITEPSQKDGNMWSLVKGKSFLFCCWSLWETNSTLKDGGQLFEVKCFYRQWQKPRRHQVRSAAPVAWCQRRSPWIPPPCPWMSADASWPCFARGTDLESNTQGSLSTKQSQSITLDSGSFPVIIVSTLRSMQSGNLLINTNTTPRCLFWESILHTLVITTKPLVVRNRHTADTHTFLFCVNGAH